MCLCVLYSSLTTKEKRRGEKSERKKLKIFLLSLQRPLFEISKTKKQKTQKKTASLHRLPLQLVFHVERAQREQAEEDARRERAVCVVPVVFDFEFFLRF